MSQLSSGQKLEAIDVDVHLLFGIRGSKRIVTVESASPGGLALL